MRTLTSIPSFSLASHRYKLGILDLLIPFAFSDVEGLRSAACASIRNVFVEDDRYKQDFIQMGGIEAFVGFLRI